VTLFRRRPFVGISLATFCIAAGMFGMLPYLSIYLQDLRGLSQLAAGVRYLPMTAFVFIVPIATRRLAARTPLWVMVTAGFALVSVGLVLMRLLVSSDSSWTRLLPGLIVAGVGIGLSNPALAAGALRVVDPARSGMASGISNTFRVGGVAIGVAALGALLENRIAAELTSTVQGDLHSLANVVSSRGVRGVAAHVSLVHSARVAFVGAFGDLLVVGAVMLAVGAIVALTTARPPFSIKAVAVSEIDSDAAS
jgi:predicted MFS family arabinose efflux permease